MDGTELAKVSHPLLDRIYERMCASKNATSCPFRLHERRLGLTEVVERGVGVLVERPRVVDPDREREIMTFSENSPRYGYHCAKKCLSFFEAVTNKVSRKAIGCY